MQLDGTVHPSGWGQYRGAAYAAAERKQRQCMPELRHVSILSTCTPWPVERSPPHSAWIFRSELILSEMPLQKYPGVCFHCPACSIVLCAPTLLCAPTVPHASTVLHAPHCPVFPTVLCAPTVLPAPTVLCALTLL